MMYVWYSSTAETTLFNIPSSNSSSQGSALCKNQNEEEDPYGYVEEMGFENDENCWVNY
jgi:hypothetical protein